MVFGMRAGPSPLWPLTLMAGMGRNVPLSPASTEIPKPGFEELNPSPGIESPQDVLTIVLMFAAAAVLLVLGMALVAFLWHWRLP